MATSVLREYIVKCFALDDELLKKGSRFGKDYFDQLPLSVISEPPSKTEVHKMSMLSTL